VSPIRRTYGGGVSRRDYTSVPMLSRGRPINPEVVSFPAKSFLDPSFVAGSGSDHCRRSYRATVTSITPLFGLSLVPTSERQDFRSL